MTSEVLQRYDAGMEAPQTVTFSEFLRGPNPIAEMAYANDVVLTRRNDEDLLLSTVWRQTYRDEATTVAASALRSLARSHPDLVAAALVDELPWLSWLPDDEEAQCVKQMVVDLAAGASVKSYRAFFQHMIQWKHTAEIYADPELLAEITRPLTGPEYGPVPRPGR